MSDYDQSPAAQHSAPDEERRQVKTRRTNVGGKPFSSRNPTTIGAIGLVLIVVLLWAAFNASSLPIIGGGTTYTAYFTADAGLRSGDEVRVSGVKVGAVSSIGLRVGWTNPATHKAETVVKVTFKIKDAYIGDDSQVAIALKTLLGEKYIAIDDEGSKKQNPSDPIPLSRTTSPFDVYPAFQDLTQKIDSINTSDLSKALGTLSQAFQNTPASLKQALTGLSSLSTTISNRNAELQQLLNSADAVTGVLADRDTQLQKLFSDGNLLLQELNERNDAIHQLLLNTTQLSIELEGLVADNQKTIGPLLASLQKVLNLLNANQAVLDQGLALLGPFYRVFNNTIGNGRWFDNYICNLSPNGILGILGLNSDSGQCS